MHTHATYTEPSTGQRRWVCSGYTPQDFAKVYPPDPRERRVEVPMPCDYADCPDRGLNVPLDKYIARQAAHNAAIDAAIEAIYTNPQN